MIAENRKLENCRAEFYSSCICCNESPVHLEIISTETPDSFNFIALFLALFSAAFFTAISFSLLNYKGQNPLQNPWTKSLTNY